MKIEILVAVIVLALILTITAFIVIIKKSKKPVKVDKKTEIQQDNENIEFDDLMAIVKNPNSTSKDILNALELFNQNYTIDEANGQKYFIFLSRCLTHKNVNKDVFRYFHNEVKKKNLKYKNELESMERKALG